MLPWLVQGYQILAQSSLDWSQMRQYWEFFRSGLWAKINWNLILKGLKFVPFGANLTPLLSFVSTAAGVSVLRPDLVRLLSNWTNVRYFKIYFKLNLGWRTKCTVLKPYLKKSDIYSIWWKYCQICTQNQKWSLKALNLSRVVL